MKNDGEDGDGWAENLVDKDVDVGRNGDVAAIVIVVVGTDDDDNVADVEDVGGGGGVRSTVTSCTHFFSELSIQ